MQQSQRVGQYMVFDRPTGLASQVQKADDMRPDAREFDLLKDHFERLLRTNAGFPVTVTPATGLVLPPRYTSVRAPSTRVAISVTGESASGHAADTQVMEDDMDGNFMGVVLDHDHVEDEGRVVEDLITLTEADQISTLAQRSTQLADEPYHLARIRQERIHLRVKRSKRCRSCRHVIVKPEQKAVATRFKINILAMHYVPIITLMQLTELRQGESQRIVLKFTNPLYFPIRIKLSSPDKQVKILAHDFSVGDFSDVFEYEEELSGLNARSATYVAMRRSASGRSATLPTGIWDQRSNFTAIIIDVQPTEPTADYCIPLLVYYAYVETPEEDDDFSVEEEEEEDDEEMDEGGSQASATLRLKKRQEDSVKSSEDDGGILREMEFWATIGLGKVVPKPQELQIPYSNDALFMD
jgi:dynactin-4